MTGTDALSTAADVLNVTSDQCAAALDQLNVHIRNHGGQVEIASFDAPRQRLTVRLTGLCTSCPAWPMTLYGLIRPFFRDELGIEDVQIADRRISDAAVRRITAAFEGVR